MSSSEDIKNAMKDMINDDEFKEIIKGLMQEAIRDIFSSSNESYNDDRFKEAIKDLMKEAIKDTMNDAFSPRRYY